MATKEEKIKNAICFFAQEHEKLAHEPLGLNSLHKYLASLGYRSSEKSQNRLFSVLGGVGKRYIIVDIDGKQTKVEGDCFSLVLCNGAYAVRATGSPDLDCFSPFELLGMKRTVEVGVAGLTRRVDSGFDIREAEKRRVWVGKNFDVGHYETIDEPSYKYREVGEMTGLHMLTQRYVKQLEELETRMKETKHKLEVVMEASRLLEEEGLSEDRPSGTFQRE